MSVKGAGWVRGRGRKIIYSLQVPNTAKYVCMAQCFDRSPQLTLQTGLVGVECVLTKRVSPIYQKSAAVDKK